MIKKLIKKCLASVCTFIAHRSVGKFGKGFRCNFYCHFTGNTKIGNNCSFNGMDISGNGIVIIGDNFHSGKHIRIITSFHNWAHQMAMPYDGTYSDRDVIIEENV